MFMDWKPQHSKDVNYLKISMQSLYPATQTRKDCSIPSIFLYVLLSHSLIFFLVLWLKVDIVNSIKESQNPQNDLWHRSFL